MRRIAGIGFRAQADAASIADALARATAEAGCAPDALATPADRADALRAFAGSLPVIAVEPAAMIAAQGLRTASPRIMALRGVGSVAEAAALAAAGHGARLLCARQTSADRMATAAIAEADGP